jgi:hypothetical protein
MESNNASPDPADQVVQEKPGLVSRILMVFYEPARLFRSLTAKTSWLLPFIVIVILGGIAGHFVRPIMARDQGRVILKNMENYRQYMSAEQYEETMRRIKEGLAEAEENPVKWYHPLVMIGVPFVFLVIISAIGLVAGNFLFGGKVNFWMVMNVVAFAALIGLLGDLVRSAMALSKGSMHVYTGLGLLSFVGDDSFLFYFFRQIDVFSIWRIIVTSIGLGVVYNMKPKKFGYVLFSVWLVFIVAVAILNATILMGGFVY